MLSLLKKHPMNLIQWQIVGVWFLVALGQLQRWQITAKVATYGHEWLMLISLASLMVLHFRQIKKDSTKWVKQRPWWNIILVGVIVAGWIGSAWQEQPVMIGILYAARVVFYVLWIKIVTKYSSWSGLTLWTGWLLVGTAVGFLGLLQYVFVPDTRFLSSLGWDDHYFRLISSWFDPAFTGLVLAGTVIGWLWHPLFRSKTWGLLLQTAMLSCAAACVLTFSRSSFLAMGIGSGVSLFKMSWHQKKWLFSALAVMMVVLVLAPKKTGEGVALARTSTIEARTSAAEMSLKQLSGVQWLIGRGMFVPFPTSSTMSNPASVDHGRQADNSLIFSVVSLGLIGGALWWWGAARYLVSVMKLQPVAGILAIVWLGHSLFNNSLFQPLILLTFWGSISALTAAKLGTQAKT